MADEISDLLFRIQGLVLAARRAGQSLARYPLGPGSSVHT
jgi:hypothetical protein